jgi:pimeloyl-ACP methyl ester carboxylesterase
MQPTRRKFLKSTGAAGLATALAAAAGRSIAQVATDSRPRTVRTAVLDIGYEEHGDAAGTAIILLHGFPYDVRSFDGVVAPLVAAGHRVLVPWLRGYGPTRFRDASAPRMAEQVALAQDVFDFADALGIERFALAGFDWGNRAACIVSILEPRRVIGQVSVGGYSVQNTIARGGSMPARQAAQFWYMWYFNTEQGAAALQANRHDLIRYLWETWSPQWQYTDEAYARSAPSFDNPDFVAVVVHSYRHRLMNAPGEERFQEIEARLAAQPPVDVPAIVLAPGATGLGGRPAENPAGDQRRFTKLVARRIVEGAGHDLPAHRPDAVAQALLELVG